MILDIEYNDDQQIILHPIYYYFLIKIGSNEKYILKTKNVKSRDLIVNLWNTFKEEHLQSKIKSEIFITQVITNENNKESREKLMKYENLMYFEKQKLNLIKKSVFTIDDEIKNYTANKNNNNKNDNNNNKNDDDDDDDADDKYDNKNEIGNNGNHNERNGEEEEGNDSEGDKDEENSIIRNNTGFNDEINNLSKFNYLDFNYIGAIFQPINKTNYKFLVFDSFSQPSGQVEIELSNNYFVLKFEVIPQLIIKRKYSKYSKILTLNEKNDLESIFVYDEFSCIKVKFNSIESKQGFLLDFNLKRKRKIQSISQNDEIIKLLKCSISCQSSSSLSSSSPLSSSSSLSTPKNKKDNSIDLNENWIPVNNVLRCQIQMETDQLIFYFVKKSKNINPNYYQNGGEMGQKKYTKIIIPINEDLITRYETNEQMENKGLTLILNLFSTDCFFSSF